MAFLKPLKKGVGSGSISQRCGFAPTLLIMRPAMPSVLRFGNDWVRGRDPGPIRQNWSEKDKIKKIAF